MSANSAVTVLRSPSSASGELLSGATRTLEADPCGVEVATAAPAPFASGAPHLPQKLDVGGFSALHFAQCFASAFPHFAQKLFVEGLFVPHFEQPIKSLGRQATGRSVVTRSGNRHFAPSIVETHFFQQRDEARLGTKWIEDPVHLQPQQ